MKDKKVCCFTGHRKIDDARVVRIPEALDKLREVRKIIDESGKVIDLQIDGGVTAENVEEIKAAGANVIVAGSAVFKAEDRAAMIRALKA